MKFLHLALTFCVLLFSGSIAFAQTVKTVERGSIINLLGGIDAVSYQWQVSSDGNHFIDLPNEINQNLTVKVNAPAFYRVKTSDESAAVIYGKVTQVSLSQINYSSEPSVSSGAHGFVENGKGMPGSGISIPEDRNGAVAGVTKSLTQWTNGDAVAVFYINHPNDVVDTKMNIDVKSGTHANFCLKVYDPNQLKYPLATTFLTVEGTGKSQNVFLAGIKFPHKGYYRYELSCLNGWENINSIDRFTHESPSTEKSYKSGYLSSPSVHLRNWRSSDPTAPTGNVYDWCYQEVMMPTESDIPGTYIMSLGVLDGYMGIQMNGYMPDGRTRHDVIFSMWDDGDTDKNPNLPENLRSNLVDISPIATSERFGNEGTGIKSFVAGHHWECGKFVQFITNCRTEMATYEVIENGQVVTKQQENTLVSAWFNAQDGKGWQYISTLRLANKHKRFNSWYSFLENYNHTSGQLVRKGYYRNGYACTTEGGSPQWYHFNKVDFGNTDGGPEEGKRNDFGQGGTNLYSGKNGEQSFFMSTGGFIDKKVTASEVALNANNIAVDTIRLDVLLDRVEQAIVNEKYTKIQNDYLSTCKLDKKNFKIVDFSSEELSGEGSNGAVALIIDGKKETYWHSKWTSGGSRCPHQITVDLADEKIIDALEITMSGGSNRYMKAFNLYVSNDDVQNSDRSWTKIYSTDDAPNQETFKVILDKQSKGRFLKMEVTESRANDGDHVRINELEVFGQSVKIAPLNKKTWEVVKFSSEETTGEGNNGRAKFIIDGNVDTYWHSAWQSGTGETPHVIAVDMKEINLLEAMQITMSGGSARYIKEFNLYMSLDNCQWNKVYSDTDAPNAETFKFDLPENVKARYFKIEVLSSRDAKGVHTRINEVELMGRVLSSAENMMLEAEDLLKNPNAHNVGYPSDVHFSELQRAYDCLTESNMGVDAGTNLMKALGVYKTTDDINLPKNNVIYTLTSEGRGSLMADDKNNRLQSTKHSSMNVSPDYRNAKQQFVFVYKEGKPYLYNCYFKKYMTDNADALSEEPLNPILVLKHPGYEGHVFMKFDNSHNVNFGGANQLVIDGWGTPDAGNAFVIEEVGILADMKSSAGSLKEKNIATFSAPYAVMAEEGANVYYATENNAQTAILLHSVPAEKAIPENAGVLVASDALSKVKLIKAGVEVESADLVGNVLQASASGPVIMKEGDYILTKPKNKNLAFYRAKVGSVLSQYRSYLHLTSPAATIRMMYVDGGVTAIEDTFVEKQQKAPIYDLSGRIVNKIVKGGVYIQNGKKILFK